LTDEIDIDVKQFEREDKGEGDDDEFNMRILHTE
jgi:hypothetical protein